MNTQPRNVPPPSPEEPAHVIHERRVGRSELVARKIRRRRGGFIASAERSIRGDKPAAPQPNSYLFPFLPAPPTPPPIPLVVEASAGAGAGGEMEGMGQQKRRPLVVMASAQAAARAGPTARGADRPRQDPGGRPAGVAGEAAHARRGRRRHRRRGRAGRRPRRLMGTLAPDGGSPFPVPQPPPGADPNALASFKQAQVSSSSYTIHLVVIQYTQ